MSLTVVHFKIGDYQTSQVELRNNSEGSWYNTGRVAPNFPVPALVYSVGYQPEHPSQLYPSAYWYVCTQFMLWSFFQRLGLIVEKV